MLLSATVAFSACSEGDDPTYLAGPFNEFVTITQMTSSTVTYSAYTDNSVYESTLCSYQSELVPTDKYAVGDRVYITYMLNSAVTSPDPTVAAVQLQSVAKVITPAVTLTPAADCNTDGDVASVTNQPYMAGPFINLSLWYGTVKQREFYCYLDESSLAGDVIPRLYLSSKTVVPADESEAGSKTFCPVSINMNDVWNKVASNTVELYISTTSGKPAKYTFVKR